MNAFHRQVLHKPDGRKLLLYSRDALPPPPPAPMPLGDSPVDPNPHLRWHPLRGEWVVYAGYRQNRTFLPPPEYNPLATTRDPANPTELPPGPWQVAVFENRFPSMAQSARVAPGTTVPSSPAKGACEVVVFTQDPNSSLGALPLERLDLLLQVWGDRTEELGELTDIEYVMPFENRGVEVGVTLHHPHGQIYAFPFVPPVAERELQQQELHYQRHQKPLLEQLIEGELLDTRRVVYGGDFALGFVPAFARYSYELWVAPKRAAPFLTSLRDDERWDLAKALKTVLLKLDGLWGRPFPYVMALHQAPTDGQPHPEWHLHFELYPALRMPGRLKYLAGSELGAGVFTADTLPEEKAEELRKIEVKLE